MKPIHQSNRNNLTRAVLLCLAILTSWLLTACTQPAASEPPTVSDPKISAPTPQEPGQEVGISVDVSSASGASLTYAWRVDGGEIVRGDGSPAITYRTPDEPGIYNVRVAVMWDDSSLEKITTIRVEAPATASADKPSTDTPTPEPTDAPPTATAPPPTSTLEPTATLVPATATPAPTNTPRPTPVPTATIDADPTVYDNFNNPAFDGSFNQGLWEDWGDSSTVPIQQDGILIAAQGAEASKVTRLMARRYNGVTVNSVSSFEARLMLDPERHAGEVMMRLDIDVPNMSNFAETKCKINNDGQAYCEYISDIDNWERLYSTSRTFVGYGNWQTFGIQIDTSTMTYTYYRNDDVIGSFIPPNVEKIKKNAYYEPTLGVNNWGMDSTDPVVGYIDDVRIGMQ